MIALASALPGVTMIALHSFHKSMTMQVCNARIGKYRRIEGVLLTFVSRAGIDNLF